MGDFFGNQHQQTLLRKFGCVTTSFPEKAVLTHNGVLVRRYVVLGRKVFCESSHDSMAPRASYLKTGNHKRETNTVQ